MASERKSYPAVEKVQTFLNGELAKGTITGAPLEVDGKWGPLTMEAFWAWVSTQPAGSDLSVLTALGVVTDAEQAVLDKAIAEHTKITAEAEVPKTPPPATLPGVVTLEKKGWSTMTWVLLGAAVAGAGLLGWYVVKQQQQKKLPSRASAGMDDAFFGDDEFGEGTMVSLGRKGKKSGCGCGG